MSKLTTQVRDLKLTAKIALEKTVLGSSEQVKSQVVSAIHDRYAFSERSYIEDRIDLKVDPNLLEITVFARHRISNAINFIQDTVYRNSVNPRTPNKLVLSGYIGEFLRGKQSHWKGAFIFVGKSNNSLLAYRNKGETTRDIPNVSYGPSIAGSLAVVSDQVEPLVIQMLTKKYNKLL
ncbi:hypothetical protein [Pseudoalteromonas luteoviolacea]|uniref:hypothetical protein n=1 Tax=Pseudoalteromonas luteoviolacea TaxID=43657 RepID=UPI001B38D5D8|nr:hypothetical protein [Pseudoalteromonas luteoviolacea]MBQ4836042.1 hypothetical protein [Pseudoalteromonas luteoviolacea]